MELETITTTTTTTDQAHRAHIHTSFILSCYGLRHLDHGIPKWAFGGRMSYNQIHARYVTIDLMHSKVDMDFLLRDTNRLLTAQRTHDRHWQMVKNGYICLLALEIYTCPTGNELRPGLNLPPNNYTEAVTLARTIDNPRLAHNHGQALIQVHSVVFALSRDTQDNTGPAKNWKLGHQWPISAICTSNSPQRAAPHSRGSTYGQDETDDISDAGRPTLHGPEEPQFIQCAPIQIPTMSESPTKCTSNHIDTTPALSEPQPTPSAASTEYRNSISALMVSTSSSGILMTLETASKPPDPCSVPRKNGNVNTEMIGPWAAEASGYGCNLTTSPGRVAERGT